MKLISEGECYSKMIKAEYGYDAYGNKIEAPKAHFVINESEQLLPNDLVFDIYSGWLKNKYNKRYHQYAVSEGRWTTWARKKSLILRPGPGWKHLKGSVWEYKNGMRIHTGGLILRDSNGVIGPVDEFAHRSLLYRLIRINGGNKKRGLMAFAMNFVENIRM